MGMGNDSERAALLTSANNPAMMVSGETGNPGSRPQSGLAIAEAYGYDPGIFEEQQQDELKAKLAQQPIWIRSWELTKKTARQVWGRKLRTIVLFFMLIVPAIAFALEEEQGSGGGHGGGVSKALLIPLSSNEDPYVMTLDDTFGYRYIEAELLYDPATLFKEKGSNRQPEDYPDVVVTLTNPASPDNGNVSQWTVLGNAKAGDGPMFKQLIKNDENLKGYQLIFSLVTKNDNTEPVAVQFVYHGVSSAVDSQVLFGLLILLFVYFLIITELIHRTLAAMLGSFITLGVLSVLNKRPSLEVIIQWIDFETVMLLFGMMIIVGVLAETGVFEYAAVKAYKFSRGKVWPLLTMLVMFSAVVSAFLDNVTTILLLTPVTIRMCNVIGLDPTPILLAEVVFSNIGGTATAVGDPPNVIIVSSKWSEVVVPYNKEGQADYDPSNVICLEQAGCEQKDIEFTELTAHLFIGIIFVTAACYAQLRFMYRNTIFNNPDSPRVAELKREIAIWTRTMAKQPSTTREERSFLSKLNAKIEELNFAVKEAESSDQDSWAETVRMMEMDAQIKDFDLFYNTCLVLFVVILLFFLHSIPEIHLDLGWIAILGAIALLLISGIQNVEELMMKVEWATLLFFGALFILMEGLGELGLIDAIGTATSDAISDFPDESRKTWSIVLVLWVSALSSSFIDNIPFTAAMIPVIKKIGASGMVPLRPLVWSLAFGACLGGNGTLIGASANVVMVGLAEQEGITISFNRFFTVGFPIMLLSTTVAMFYLLLCHAAFSWDEPF
jgi:Na+/H+ antiporter NhaD/arsenite permease-like protein